MGTSNVMRALALATVCLLQFAPLVVRAQSSEPEEIVVSTDPRGVHDLGIQLRNLCLERRGRSGEGPLLFPGIPQGG